MRILAVDYGESRTGLAICDSMETLASPAGTISEKNTVKAVEAVAERAKELRAEAIVVGLPRNMDGSEGERAQKCRRVAEMLAEQTGLPVESWDERGTTKTAILYMNETDTRGKKRKSVLDQAAAAIILESYISYRKNHRG